MLIKNEATLEDLRDMITNYLEINDFADEQNQEELIRFLHLLEHSILEKQHLNIVAAL